MTTTLTFTPNALRTFAPVCRLCGMEAPIGDCCHWASPGCHKKAAALHRLWLETREAKKGGAARFERWGWAAVGLISAAALGLGADAGAALA